MPMAATTHKAFTRLNDGSPERAKGRVRHHEFAQPSGVDGRETRQVERHTDAAFCYQRRDSAAQAEDLGLTRADPFPLLNDGGAVSEQ